MRRRYARTLTLFLVIVVLLTACAGGSGINPSSEATSTFSHLSITPIVPDAPQQIKIGIVVFLSGGAAEPFGLPAQNGAELIIDAINRGTAPAPYSQPGIAGVPITVVYVDEAGGAETQVSEWRRLFEEEQVDLVIGYSSSSDCLAVAPVAEENQKLTVIFDCGTSRLFEERNYRYVFRTNAHQAIDSLAGARYLLHARPDLQTIAGINQNYSWGQDSWAHFRDTLQILRPEVQIVDEQFPKLAAGDYRAEIASLISHKPEAVHTSFWGADLETFVSQALSGKLNDTSLLLLSVGEYVLPDLKEHIPAGTIIGAHGTHGILAPPGPLNDWLVRAYQERYQARPTYPVYHMAQAILGVKFAYEQAALQRNQWPNTEQVIDAFEYLEFPTPSGVIQLAIGKGHQAVEPAAYGAAGSYNPTTQEVNILDVMLYTAVCINPPEGVTTEQWIKEGFPGSNCP